MKTPIIFKMGQKISKAMWVAFLAFGGMILILLNNSATQKTKSIGVFLCFVVIFIALASETPMFKKIDEREGIEHDGFEEFNVR